MKAARKASAFTKADRASRIVYHHVELDDGRVVALFINRDTRLVTLDIVDADEGGGCEVYRKEV